MRRLTLGLITGLVLVCFLSAQAGAVENTQITISAVGDCTLGNDSNFAYQASFNDVFNKQKGNHYYFFSKVKEILAEDDLTVANLEGPLTDKGKKADKQFSFRGSPSYTNILLGGSVEVVNLANNHTYDYGEIGYQDTKRNLQNAGIKYFGNETSCINKVNGLKVGFLGYNQLRYGASKEFQQKIAKDIKSLKNQCNLVIVSFHWGEEKKYYPNATQRLLGHLAVESGADLVLGHHPHVMQGIERYKGAYIVYSLGNFCFGGNRNPRDKDTFIYQQVFTFDQAGKIIKDGNKRIIPCSISSSNSINNYQPIILSGSDRERVLKRMTNYSSVFLK